MATNTSAVSARKVEANRRNAQKSTGPRTAEGKARAAQNAMVLHGFYSSRLLLEGEDAGELDALREELVDDLRPRGAAERLIVERLVAAHWKLRRLHETEQRMLDHQLGQLRRHGKPGDATPAAALAEMVYAGAELDRISIYERRLEGSIHRCHRELRQLRKDRDQREAEEGREETEVEEQASTAGDGKGQMENGKGDEGEKGKSSKAKGEREGGGMRSAECEMRNECDGAQRGIENETEGRSHGGLGNLAALRAEGA